MKKRRRYPIAAAAVVLVVAVACDGDEVQVTPPEPTAVPGTLVLSLITPNADDGAILFSVSGGEISAPTAVSSSHLIFFRATGESSINAVVVGDLTEGALMSFDVPDVMQASSYSATVTQVSDRGNALRDNISEYALSVSVQ